MPQLFHLLSFCQTNRALTPSLENVWNSQIQTGHQASPIYRIPAVVMSSGSASHHMTIEELAD